MFQGGMSRAHGGQGGSTARAYDGPAVQAILRGTTGDIRVWSGIAGKREEFTIAEARELCTKIDVALTNRSDGAEAGLWLDDGGAMRPLIVARGWLISLLAALRRALRTADAAQAMAPKAFDEASVSKCIDVSGSALMPKCIDMDSDPGAWGRHLRHTAPLRGVDADSS